MMDPKMLGEAVLLRRRRLDIGQQELARRASISRNYVSVIERGEAQNVSTAILERLATALHVTITEMYEGIDGYQGGIGTMVTEQEKLIYANERIRTLESELERLRAERWEPVKPHGYERITDVMDVYEADGEMLLRWYTEGYYWDVALPADIRLCRQEARNDS